MGFIYKITNKINGMNYVGQTIQILEERWRQHRKIGSNCLYLKRAFEKYGIDNFTFTMICVCFDEDLDKFEIQYMKSLNSIVPNGYNLRCGGNSGKHHEETKNKISKALKALKGRTDIFRYHLGKHLTEETKNKISKALKGRTDIIRNSNHFRKTGMRHTEKSKNKMSVSHKKKVDQYDLDNIFIKSFDSIADAAAAAEIKICRDNIGRVCSGKKNTAGGFKWKYNVSI
jgi:group I intron endonuclease